MKNKISFNDLSFNKNLLNCSEKSANKSFVFVWSEVKSFSGPNEKLGGMPNIDPNKFKKPEFDQDGKPVLDAAGKQNEISTEDINKAEGRNIIRGQALMILKHFPYEAGSKNINDLVALSRKHEIAAINGLPDLAKEAADPVTHANNLKQAIDEFRTNFTEDKVVKENGVDVTKKVWKAPSQLKMEYPDLASLPEGRSFLIEAAQRWLEANPGDKDYPTVKDAMLKAIKIQTGQWKVEHSTDNITTPETAATGLKLALDGKTIPAPKVRQAPPQPAEQPAPTQAPEPKPEKKKEDPKPEDKVDKPKTGGKPKVIILDENANTDKKDTSKVDKPKGARPTELKDDEEDKKPEPKKSEKPKGPNSTELKDEDEDKKLAPKKADKSNVGKPKVTILND